MARTNTSFQGLVSRRKVLGTAAAGAAGVVAISSVGCGDDDDDSESDPTTAPEATEEPTEAPAEWDDTATLRAVVAADLGSMDPHGIPGVNQLTDWNVFNLPVQIHPESGEVVGFTCDWEWVDGNQSLLLTAKPGIEFHNGEVLDAAQLKFNLDRARGIAEYNPEWRSSKAFFFANVNTVEIVDDSTVEITLKQIDVSFPYYLRYMSLVPKAHVEEVGDVEFAASPIGTGPFSFVSHTAETELRLARFDSYWNPQDAELGPRAAKVAEVVQIYRPETQARLAALEAGEVDFAADLTPTLAKSIEGRDDLQVFYAAEGTPVHVQFNTTPETDPYTGGPNPWRDVRVRKAVNLAVDVDTIIEQVLTGREQKAFGTTQAAIGFPTDLVDRAYGYDPDEARALLAEAGYADGFKTQFHAGIGRIANTQEVVEAIAGYLADVGIECELMILPFGEFAGQLQQKALQGLIHFSADNGAEPGNTFSNIMKSTGPFSNSSDPELGIDEMIAAQSTEFDADARADMIGEIVSTWYDNAMWLFMYETVRAHGASSRVIWPVSDYPSSYYLLSFPEYWNMALKPE